jgi:hypothetical protein
MSARLSTGLALRLLGGHVGSGAQDHAAHRERQPDVVNVGELEHVRRRALAVARLRARPKSSTFTVPSARSLMFAGFRSRWTMPCSCAASSASAIFSRSDRASDERDGAGCDALGEILPLDEFHHEGGYMPAAFLEAVDGGDVGMIERREHFASRSNRARRSGSCERRRQDLDGDLALESRVGRPVHLPHPAFPDRRGDVVNAEACAGGQGQLCRQYRGKPTAKVLEVMPTPHLVRERRRQQRRPPSRATSCVRTVSDTLRNLGQTPCVTGTRRCTPLLREVVD